MLEFFGYLSAVLIGLSLGLIGGGGSILTVPALVYLMGISPVMATAYSLFIVGASSLFGGIRYARHGLIDLKVAVIFGIPSIAAVYLTRRFVVPAIPEEVFSIADLIVTKDMLLMILFAVLMLVASIGMIRKGMGKAAKPNRAQTGITPKVIGIILLEGLVVGTLTGLVGAGGGFLIIPALVLFGGLTMKKAIGTSLLIISTKSLIGFLGDVSNYSIDWVFLATFSVLAIAGIFLGSFLASKVDGKRLKAAFGWFVLVMGIFILAMELS